MSIRRRAQLFSGLVVALLLAAAPASPPVKGATTSTINPSSGSTTAYFLGDSLTVGADAFGSLRKKLVGLGQWSSVALDARVGRTIGQGLVVLKERLRRYPATPAVFIALGTNDLLSRNVLKPAMRDYPRKMIAQVMDVAGARPVIWTNVTYGAIHPDWIRRAKRFNSALVEATTVYPNLRVVDWSAAILPTTSWYQYDGIHLSPSGYRFRATAIVSQIKAVWPSMTTTTTSSTTTTSTLAPTTAPTSPSTTASTLITTTT